MPYVGWTADIEVVSLRMLERKRLRTHGNARGHQKAMVAVMLMLLLPGCAVLGDHRVAAGCQAVDGVTTYYALKHGAVEGNSLLAGASPGAILLIKLAFAYAIYKAFDRPDVTKSERAGLGAVTFLGCVPAANNIKVIRTL